MVGRNQCTYHSPQDQTSTKMPWPIQSFILLGSKLQTPLPKTWHIHPVFHCSLITPYKATPAHGPNFTRPPPDTIEGEDNHYELETVLQSRASPNRKGILYLVKWKGYPYSENSWLTASQMKHAHLLVQQFHS
jgi:hypothetical protein